MNKQAQNNSEAATEQRRAKLVAAANQLTHPNQIVQQARRIVCAAMAGQGRGEELTTTSREAQRQREAKIYSNGAQRPAITAPKELAQLEAAGILCSITNLVNLPETFEDWFADAIKLLAVSA